MIYGYTVDALCVMRHLINELQIPGNRIKWVQPDPPPPPPPLLKNQTVRGKLSNIVQALGKAMLKVVYQLFVVVYCCCLQESVYTRVPVVW